MMKKKVAFVLATGVTAVALSACGGGDSAEDYPNDSIEMVVPWGAGGDTDVINRITTDYLEDELGTSITITNMSGGGGAIGAQEALNADNDGYTILAGHDSIAVSYLMDQTDFHYFDFEPVSLMTSANQLLATNIDNEWDSMEDVIDDVADDPESISFGATVGSTTHVVPLGIQNDAGVEFNFVNYEDTAERTQALLGNHVDIVPTTVPAAEEYIEADEIKILGILADERNEALPEVETLEEQGIDFTFGTNRGYFFPEDTPDEIVDQWDEALGNVAENEDFQQEIEEMGVEINYLDRDEYNEYLENDLHEMEDILEEQGALEREVE
ncbi:Bug family tripartite tricarboxylate transporter substrate binding protein [Salsuginibacillus kocurii]|uniref:Bug family tripartite tricarboxylate transporter substrate binding protein n=1 Tax=Salsuginibacillus kocurii TaxID=427078 RepID=UPI00035FCFBC|nr:tripartite tricarboxylate transporter substrate binding protein [Salsuginibacillus kocurii]